MVSFDLYYAGDFERVKNLDGTVSGKLFLEGFRTAVARMPVPVPGERQEFAIADRKCTVLSFTREHKVALVFDCAELEPGNTAPVPGAPAARQSDDNAVAEPGRFFKRRKLACISQPHRQDDLSM